MKKTRSTQRTLGSILLVFEAFVVFFATLVAFGLELGPAEWVWGIGITISLVMMLTPAILGKPGGYLFGSLLQVLLIISGFWIWGMFFVGAIFAGLWIWMMIAGRTVDKARENYFKQMESGENE